jgi:hypothetical protein
MLKLYNNNFRGKQSLLKLHIQMQNIEEYCSLVTLALLLKKTRRITRVSAIDSRMNI